MNFWSWDYDEEGRFDMLRREVENREVYEHCSTPDELYEANECCLEDENGDV